MRPISKKVALLCLLLTLFSAVALVAHHHSSPTDALKCTVCVTAHSASPKAVSTVSSQTFISISAIRPQAVSVQQRFVAFALSVRPPPAV